MGNCLKVFVRKVKIENISPQQLPDIALGMGFSLIPLLPKESSSYHQLVLTDHKDPFDHMLIWQAIQQDMILIGKDKNIEQYSSFGLKTLW